MAVPTARSNLRDLVDRFVPSWLSEGDEENPGFGYRILWTIVLFVDSAIELAANGALAAVGRGASVDADLVGRDRGLIRHQDETSEAYAARLGTWIDKAKENGSTRRLALAIHDYLRSHPRVRVFRRDGHCITIDTDGTLTIDGPTAWDWDSVSHPDRNDPAAPWCSDLFVVVYTTSGTSVQWGHRPGTLGGMVGADGFAFGHLATTKEVDDITGLRALCKSAHSCVRAIVWCNDETMFVPGDDVSMPDGTWGSWGVDSGGVRVPSGRDLVHCRYWEQGKDIDG